MRLLLALLIASLPACATPTKIRNAPADRRFHASTAEETALLARYPRLVERRGNVLEVSSRGGRVKYEDTDCEATADCASFSLHRAFLDGRLFGIEVGYYEGGDYIVADTESMHLFTGGPPVLSPSGHMFATAVYSEAYETSAEGVRLWALDFPMRLVRVVSPHVLTYPEQLVWRGNSCVEFIASEGTRFYEQGEENPRVTYYLVEASPEWRLTKVREPRCVMDTRSQGR